MLGVPPAQVAVTGDLLRRFGPWPGAVATVTDPDTRVTYRFLARPGEEGSAMLLLDECAECTGVSVPVAEIETLADLGRYLAAMGRLEPAASDTGPDGPVDGPVALRPHRFRSSTSAIPATMPIARPPSRRTSGRRRGGEHGSTTQGMPESAATSAPRGFDAVGCGPLVAGGGYAGRTVRAAWLGDQLAGIEAPVMTGRTAARSAAHQGPMMVVIPIRGDARAEPMPTEQELPATLRDRIGCGLFEAIGAEVGDLVVTVWCDEEGALDPDAQMNVRIVRAFAEGGNPALPLSGVVVVTGGPDRHGNTRGLPARLARNLTDRFNRPVTGEDMFSVFKGLTHPAVRQGKPSDDATPSRDGDPFP